MAAPLETGTYPSGVFQRERLDSSKQSFAGLVSSLGTGEGDFQLHQQSDPVDESR